jgi:hypothetical protein
MAKRVLSNRWMLIGAVVLVGLAWLLWAAQPVARAVNGCAANQFYCPGVGCLSGPDKCKAGNAGGPARVFSSVEHFEVLRPADLKQSPVTEPFEASTFGTFPKVSPPRVERKSCPGGTRSDGACLMEFFAA